MDKRIFKQLVRNMGFAVNPMCCGAVATVPASKQAICEKQFVVKTIKIINLQ